MRVFFKRRQEAASGVDTMKTTISFESTGWDHDIRPIYVALLMPEAPVLGLVGVVTRQQAIERADDRLRKVFSDKECRTELLRVANVLLRERKLDGQQAHDLVVKSRVLEVPILKQMLAWQPA